MDTKTIDLKRARTLKALIQRRMAEKRQGKDLVAPDPPPRYDEIFEEGQKWLDELT
jgi:hypothetical protein